ncbi:Phosphoribosylglycinamide formyltransferase, chloroplastic [Quillaja saponaria]|uniref:Phosphoribosylglycinamide formyltransferase, chloroplastic n=1 Tax=Quillaja saponaria TaxID=32244 RepID=A0AAD7PUZ0_QUISA|nr:Phosphoribosylglycinamide formyltransferase, chloroplastic [Quillaja saponaria]
MEAQNVCTGLCLESAIPSIKIVKNSIFARLSPPPSSCVFLRSQKWVFYRASYSISNRVWPRKRIECRSMAEQVEVVGFDGEEIRAEVRRKKLAIFVSGGGSNFRSIHEATIQGSIHGDVVVLVASKSGCGGAEYAKNTGIQVILFPKTKDEPDGLSPSGLVDTLRRLKVDFILLAGYLKLIPVELIRAYPRSIVNIHPSLLPSFGGKGYYGRKVHKAVIASGARYSGPTIHFVDEHYDTGRILAQRVVPVLANDSVDDLAARVLQEEHRLYVVVAAALCEERIIWREDGVPLIRGRENPDELF